MVCIKPNEAFGGHHVYASDGDWEFDHNGWTKESELLWVTEAACTQKYAGWGYAKHVIGPAVDSLETFCKANAHRLPWQFAHLTWDHAYKYIQQFSPIPPKE